jgi:plasmid stability protein
MQSLINGGCVASITIRDIDERLRARLRVQAAHHGHSMEEEAREILRTALSTGWEAARAIFDEDFAGQVLSFDNDAADMYAEISASRRSAGKPISQFHAMIVAMTRSRGAGLATRNVKDLEDCGVKLVNPWAA